MAPVTGVVQPISKNRIKLQLKQRPNHAKLVLGFLKKNTASTNRLRISRFSTMASKEIADNDSQG
jgi:hypothetical protein